MKIVVLDGKIENPGDLSWDGIASQGELTVFDDTVYDEKAIVSRIGDAEVIYTNKTPVTEKILAQCPNVRMISVLATGYNVVDVQAAKKRGIPVTNVPCYGTQAVAQHTIALLLELCNRVGHHSDAVHQGAWAKCGTWCFWDHPLIELSGKTLGIIGMGRIGAEVAKTARALGMNVIAYSRSQRPEHEGLCQYVSFDDLLKNADVISLHCPQTENTSGLICKETIRKMKDGAILLNTARGGLIVEADLAEALSSGKLYAAAMDVMQTEPPKQDNPLLSCKNCLLTPHIAWAPKQSRQRLMDVAAENLRQFRTGTPINVVNP